MIARDEVEFTAARVERRKRRASVMRLVACVAIRNQGGHRVVIVEPESCAPWAPTRTAGTPAEVDAGGIAADAHGASVRLEQ